MKLDRDYVFGIAFWVVIGGLIVWGYGVATAKKDEKAATTSTSHTQRMKATAATISASPKTTSWETPQGTVIALDIPKPLMGGSFVEVKHCIVWRDAVTKSSALHCDKDEIDTRDYPTDQPEITQ